MTLRRPRTVLRPRVFWVGPGMPLGEPIALKPTRTSGSWEGVGLSVSLHPAAWTRIAKLGGGLTHELRRIDGERGRFAVYQPSLSGPAAAWGVAEGWVSASHQWLVPYRDSESDEEMQSVFDSEAEALAEAASDDLDEGEIQRVAAVSATPKLRRRLETWFKGRRRGSLVLRTDAAVELVNLYVAATWPELDGLWWEEALRPEARIAPRGVIFPHALSRWQAARVVKADAEAEGW